LKKRRDIIINYDTSENYYVRAHVKNNPVTTITIYVYKKELLYKERVAKINIILLFPQILGNEVLENRELERGVYERVH
jgi:NAD(P)H-flavin reductase